MTDPFAPEKYDPEKLIESFTGFDEIAIETYFRKSFAAMGQSTMALRAAQFVVNRRSGMKDNEAYKACMNITFGELTANFVKGADDESGEA